MLPVAASSAGGNFHVEVDGVSKAAFMIPNTGDGKGTVAALAAGS